MPLIRNSSFVPPRFFSNGHVQSMFPLLFRKVRGVRYKRERMITPDKDFIDLDWIHRDGETVALLLHGLEGHTYRPYMLGMAKAMQRLGIAVASMNFRGCSGTPNRLLKSYHHGSTDDLDSVITHILNTTTYEKIILIGFSLGGNVILKYLGEKPYANHSAIISAIAISTPCDLASCAGKLAEPSNALYMKRFLKLLHKKVKAKMTTLPGLINDIGYDKIKTFKDFDDRYTAPIHGFTGAEDYWAKCASKQFLSSITIPSLLLNAKNDPFLTEKCCPWEIAQNSPHLFFEHPHSGGHVGFISFNKEKLYWHEQRTLSFIQEHFAESLSY